MRLIDADKLVSVTLTDGGYWTKEVYYKADIDAALTVYPPPNDPLTLEELREMDGEPVWCVTGSAINAGRGHWDICDWWDKNTVMFPYSGEQPRIDDCGITWTAYRRKPEGGTA